MSHNKQMKKPTEVLKAYIAGFIDGEGTINISKTKRRKNSSWYYSLNTIISNTKPTPLRLIQKYYGGFLTEQKITKLTRNQGYLLKISTYNSYKLLKDIKEYSILKRKHIRIAMIFMGAKKRSSPMPGKRCDDSFIAEQEECKKRMNKLNRRGKPYVNQEE